MLKSLRFGMMGFLLLCLAGSLSAQSGPRSYFMVGLGMQFDLAQLGGTITKDGLDSRLPVTNNAGALTGGQQKAIYSENTLVSLKRSTGGVIGGKNSGAMTGGNINIGYEKEGIFGLNNLFFRINANYTTKIAGGDTTSTVMGYKWLDQEWNYTAVTVPTYIGVKLYNAANDTAVYIGGGVNYFKGMWNVSGTINAPGLELMTAGLGSNGSPLLGRGGALLGDVPSPGVAKENAKFGASGFGFNWIVGAQTKVTDKGHLFFELETILSAGMGVAGVTSVGGASALAPWAAYPVVVGGQTYRVGYKIEI
ncbi:porin OmpL1 [Leptospira sp. 85282-16]|uniref:Porin OmpL1 n=1 Tax=Leptospira montravelensis TaxID=2484961 RepID=A0ABY2LMW5_9LEPT|nr:MULTISPECIES: porin OmpL1 [Leptospira]MCT8333394.1 porin OmpL1 [Leptospira sp. 85282-16]TGK79838.1 porin OmpL1 [Leptospira montravelensis]TGL00002.1 porin OmpL1 [Leptospira montravelensis]